MTALERRTMHCLISRPLRVFVILTLLLGSAWALTSSPDLAQLMDAIRSEMHPDQAMGFMQRVYSTDRWFTYPKFQETAEFLKSTMKDIGLKNVELLAAPADGTS